MSKLKLKIIEQTFCHCEYSNNPMPPVSFSDNIEWDRNVSHNEDLVFYTDSDIMKGDKSGHRKKIAWLMLSLIKTQ